MYFGRRVPTRWATPHCSRGRAAIDVCRWTVSSKSELLCLLGEPLHQERSKGLLATAVRIRILPLLVLVSRERSASAADNFLGGALTTAILDLQSSLFERFLIIFALDVDLLLDTHCQASRVKTTALKDHGREEESGDVIKVVLQVVAGLGP